MLLWRLLNLRKIEFEFNSNFKGVQMGAKVGTNGFLCYFNGKNWVLGLIELFVDFKILLGLK